MNWRKKNRETERKLNRGFGVILMVVGSLLILRGTLKFMKGHVTIGISPIYFQPVVHSSFFDALIGVVVLVGAWSFLRRKA
jgi:hypothetical protein